MNPFEERVNITRPRLPHSQHFSRLKPSENKEDLHKRFFRIKTYKYYIFVRDSHFSGFIYRVCDFFYSTCNAELLNFKNIKSEADKVDECGNKWDFNWIQAFSKWTSLLT
jgi:hypothetical protein